MDENKESGKFLPDTLLSSEIGSAESRAAARRILSDPMLPPNFMLTFVSTPRRDDAGNCIETVEEAEEADKRKTTYAQIGLRGGKRLDRLPGESYEDFERRAAGYFPATGAGVILLLTDRDAEESKEGVVHHSLDCHH